MKASVISKKETRPQTARQSTTTARPTSARPTSARPGAVGKGSVIGSKVTIDPTKPKAL